MISVTELQQVVADTFFSSNTTSAGLVMYALILALIFAIISKRSMTAALISVMPVTLVASMMGILSTDLMILIIIVSVLGLAVYSKASVSWDPLDGRDEWGRRRQ